MDQFTFARKDQRFKRDMMKAAPGLKLGKLLDESREKIKIAPVDVIEMKTHNRYSESHSYLVSFTNEVKNIIRLNIRVK